MTNRPVITKETANSANPKTRSANPIPTSDPMTKTGLVQMFPMEAAIF